MKCIFRTFLNRFTWICHIFTHSFFSAHELDSFLQTHYFRLTESCAELYVFSSYIHEYVVRYWPHRGCDCMRNVRGCLCGCLMDVTVHSQDSPSLFATRVESFISNAAFGVFYHICGLWSQTSSRSATVCGPQSNGHWPSSFPFRWFICFFSEGYLCLGSGCVYSDCTWGEFDTRYDYLWPSFYATRCEMVMTLWLWCIICRVLGFLGLQRCFSSEMLKCYYKPVSEICVAQKQPSTMFVLDFSSCLNSQKQNIRGTHNYSVAEKKS